MRELLSRLTKARVFDLAQPYFVGMPHYPTHPPFLFSLTKRHGDINLPGGISSAADAIALGCHAGTHIDALCHFSRGGRLYGGASAAGSFERGVEALSIDTVGPILRRGVLLDLAAGAPLAEDFEILPQHLESARHAEIGTGDVVLIRTGWARYWGDARRFVNDVRGPGPGEAGARWLSGRGIFAAGSDTVAFEKVPAPAMPVHTHLIVESGIHIIECLNLEALAAAGVREFIFVAAPLKIAGGTGSPIRPFALVP